MKMSTGKHYGWYPVTHTDDLYTNTWLLAPRQCWRDSKKVREARESHKDLVGILAAYEWDGGSTFSGSPAVSKMEIIDSDTDRYPTVNVRSEDGNGANFNSLGWHVLESISDFIAIKGPRSIAVAYKDGEPVGAIMPRLSDREKGNR